MIFCLGHQRKQQKSFKQTAAKAGEGFECVTRPQKGPLRANSNSETRGHTPENFATTSL